MTETRSAGRANSFLVALALAGITAAMTQTLVVPLIAQLPMILHTSAANATWIVTATLLAGAVTTPISGRLGDLWGKRPVLLASVVPLAVGSAVCAVSSALVPMVVGRVLQGMGVGIIPVGIAALRDVLPAKKLGSGIALISSSLGIGGALSLPVAAAVVQYGSWRYLFWAVAVLAVLVGIALAVIMPKTPAAAKGRFDVVGALGLGAGLVCLLLAVSNGAAWGWTSTTIIALFAATVVVLLLWAVWELGAVREPLVDLRVTARPRILLTNIASIVVGMAMFGQSLIVPQLRQLPHATGYGLGESMLAMGLWMAPAGVVMMLVSPLGAKLSAVRGPKITLLVGCVIIAAGYGVGAGFMSSSWGLLAGTVINSLGVGFAYGAMPALVMSAVPASETAAANSFNTLMRSIGTSVSSAIVGAVLAQMSTTFGGYSIPTESGFRAGMLIGCGVAASGAVIALFIPAVRGAQATAVTLDSTPHAAASSANVIAVPADSHSVAANSPTVTGPAAFGTVSEVTGSPVADASLTLISASGQQVARTISGPDGFYELAAPAADTYVLIAAAEGWDPDASTVVLAETPVVSNVVLAGAVRLAGTVLRAHDGAPVVGATVAVLDSGGEVVVSGTTDYAGRFGVTGVGVGEFTVAVSAHGCRPGALVVDLDDRHTTEVEVCLESGVRLAGVVRGPDGGPVSEAQVTVTDTFGTVVDTLITGPDGVYSFDGVQPGEYFVIAAGFGPETAQVSVADTDLTNLDLALCHQPVLPLQREDDRAATLADQAARS